MKTGGMLRDCCGTSNCAAILFFKQGSSYDKKETDVFGLEVWALVLCSNYSWLLCTAILIWLIGGCVLSQHGLTLPHSSQVCYLWDKVTESWLKTKSLRILPMKNFFFFFLLSLRLCVGLLNVFWSFLDLRQHAVFCLHCVALFCVCVCVFFKVLGEDNVVVLLELWQKQKLVLAFWHGELQGLHQPPPWMWGN